MVAFFQSFSRMKWWNENSSLNMTHHNLWAPVKTKKVLIFICTRYLPRKLGWQSIIIVNSAQGGGKFITVWNQFSEIILILRYLVRKQCLYCEESTESVRSFWQIKKMDCINETQVEIAYVYHTNPIVKPGTLHHEHCQIAAFTCKSVHILHPLGNRKCSILYLLLLFKWCLFIGIGLWCRSFIQPYKKYLKKNNITKVYPFQPY